MDQARQIFIKWRSAENSANFARPHPLRALLTINAPLILIMRDIIFFAGKLHNGPFQGMFRGGQDFFDP